LTTGSRAEVRAEVTRRRSRHVSLTRQSLLRWTAGFVSTAGAFASAASVTGENGKRTTGKRTRPLHTEGAECPGRDDYSSSESELGSDFEPVSEPAEPPDLLLVSRPEPPDPALLTPVLTPPAVLELPPEPAIAPVPPSLPEFCSGSTSLRSIEVSRDSSAVETPTRCTLLNLALVDCSAPRPMSVPMSVAMSLPAMGDSVSAL